MRQPLWIGKTELMATLNLHKTEQTQLFGKPRVPSQRVRQRDVLRAIDIRLRDLHVNRAHLERNFVSQGLERVRIQDLVRRAYPSG